MRARTARFTDWALSKLIPIQPVTFDVDEHLQYVEAQEAAQAQAQAASGSDGLGALGSPADGLHVLRTD